MRRQQSFSCLVVFCLIMMFFSACGGNPTPPSVITIDPTQAYPFEGWGTSLAWWAEAVGQWDVSKRTALEDALFNPNTGLGLNVIRYNFGANTPDNKCSRTFRPFGSIDSYEPSNGEWDWSKDQAQLTILKDAKSSGANIFEGFSNSAPAWMLYNHCTQGNGISANLLPEHEQDYANYLATIVQHFHDDPAFGNITFRTVEPFNEPDLSWAGTQEGMAVDTSQQKRVIQDLHTALQHNEASSYTSISAPDTNSIDNAVSTLSDSAVFDPITLGELSQFNTHSYNGTQRADLYKLAHQSGKRIWMSEYTTTGTDDLGPKCVIPQASAKMIGALQLSCQISRDINLMRPNAWVYWQAVEDNAFGLLRASLGDLSKQDFTYNEQYYALWQYSHFIRPGYQIIYSGDSNNTVVAYDPTSHNLIIVEINDDQNIPRTVTYDLSNFSNIFRSATPYLTSTSQNIAQQNPISISGKKFTSIVPPNAIATYVITNAAVSVSPTAVSMSPTPSLSQLSVYASSQDGNIYALNASNGKPRWKYSTGFQYATRLHVVDGVVYFILDEDINTNPNATSTLYELDARSGTLLRKFNLPYFQLEVGAYIPDFTVVQGVIYLSSPSMIFAVNASDGSRLWQSHSLGLGVSVPVVLNGVVYSASSIGEIDALNSHDGTQVWRYELPPDEVAPGGLAGSDPAPVVVNNIVYEVELLTDNVYALNANDGTLHWHIHLNNERTRTLSVSNGTVYVNTEGILYALRTDTGAQLWSKQNLSLQLIAADTLYCFGVATDGGFTNDLYALHAVDGTTVLHVHVGSSPLRYLSVLPMTVYVMTDTTLYALHVNDGSIAWQSSISGYMVVGT